MRLARSPPTPTQLGDTHGQWGLVPVWGMSSAPALSAWAWPRAKEHDVHEPAASTEHTAAKAIGLVDQAPPDDELDAVVATLAGEICANSVGTNRRVKLLLRERFERNRPEAISTSAVAARHPRGHGRADAAAAQVARIISNPDENPAVRDLYDDGRGRRRRSC